MFIICRGITQLVNWILSGKFQYWVNGTTLPCAVIKKIQRLVGDVVVGQKWHSQKRRKKCDCVKDFFATNGTAMDKRAEKCWSQTTAYLQNGLKK